MARPPPTDRRWLTGTPRRGYNAPMTATQPAVISEGERVRIREKRIEDAERDFQWRSDPELASYDAARPISLSYRSFLASMADELDYPTIQRRTYAIEDRETGEHIGNVMYYGYDARRHEAELGITVNKGIALVRCCGPLWYQLQGNTTFVPRVVFKVVVNDLQTISIIDGFFQIKAVIEHNRIGDLRHRNVI